MKKKASLTKKVASVAAGTVLAASLYANAVYQPRNESSLEQALDRELQAVVTGQAEVKAMGDGFVVVERQAVASTSSHALSDEIAQLEAEIVTNSRAANEKLAAAYNNGAVKTVAQARRANGNDGDASTPSNDQIARAAAVIFRISGVPVGQTIGTLAAIASNPFVAAAIIEIAAASTQPGGVAAAATNAGGLSAAAQTLIATTGSTSPEGIAAAVTVAATSSTGNTVTSGGSTPASP
jgi:hypothetical protein